MITKIICRGTFKDGLTKNVCVIVMCENQTWGRCVCVCVCVCLGSIKKNGWKLHSWTLANKASKRHWRKTRIYLFYIHDSGETEVLHLKVRAKHLVFSHEMETESSQMSIALPVIWLHRRSCQTFLVFWSYGFTCTIFAWRSQLFTFIMCFAL